MKHACVITLHTKKIAEELFKASLQKKDSMQWWNSNTTSYDYDAPNFWTTDDECTILKNLKSFEI